VLAMQVKTAAASSGAIIFDGVLAFTSVDIATELDKSSLSLEWVIETAATAAEGTYLKVEGPAGMNATLAADPQNPEVGRLHMSYTGECSELPPTSGATSVSRGLGMLLPLSLTLAVSPVLRRSPAAWLLAALGSLLGESWGTTTCGTRLTLVVQPMQYARVAACGLCPQEYYEESKHFVLRPVCDINATAAALSSAMSDCGFNPSMEQCEYVPEASSCDVDGWCEFSAPPANCSIDSALAQSCLHYSFREDLREAAGVDSVLANFIHVLFQCAEMRTPVEGRPYTTESGSLVAPITRGFADADSWCGMETLMQLGVDESSVAHAALPSGWDNRIAEEVASQWISHGQEEHASVASFSRFSLELLRFAAPPQLLVAAHQAGADEVRHARHAFALASLFDKTRAGEDVSGAKLGAFPVETVHLSPDLSSMAGRAYEEGCEGESAAVARLAYAATVMSADSPARMPVKELLEDEARHAALAWATVRWALKKGARPDQKLGVSAASGLKRLLDPSPREQDHESLPVGIVWGGRIPEKQSQAIGREAARNWVQPWMQASINDINQPLPEVGAGIGPYGDAVATAAKMVRQELSRLEETSSAEIRV